MSAIPYHEEELAAALKDPEDGKNRPMLRGNEFAVLDIGCGIGQTFLAWQSNGHGLPPRCVGMDVDEVAIRRAVELAHWAHFLLQGAENIPYPAETFDVVMSRVSLPYTNVPKVLREIHRVLKPDGRIWFTLISKPTMQGLISNKRSPFYAYSMLNGWLLKHFHFVLPWKPGVYNSWQDTDAFVKMLGRFGFEAWSTKIGTQTVVEGTKR